MVITILSFFGVLVLLVLVHECGHLFAARAFRVRVDEFGLGFPPRLFSVRKGGTRYSINALPLGGFVKLAGEEDPCVPGSLASKSVGARITVLAAGSLMNFLLPLLLFSVALMVPHSVLSGKVTVQEVAPDSPAALAGIEAGDVILSVAGKQVRNIGDINRSIQLNLGNRIDVAMERSDGSSETVQLVPRWRPPPEQGAAGVMISLSDATVVRESYPFWRAIPMGVVACIEAFVIFKNVIISMIIGTAPVLIGGPVAIAQITGEAARAGFAPLLEFAAFFSINLALINIFPLPALDGGRIAFVLLEWARRGRRISAKTEGMIHMLGFLMLMAAMLAITYQDIVRIIAGESLIP